MTTERRIGRPDALDTLNVIDLKQWIPVFPLPNTVLLPRAVVPLHIFEPRYRVMTADALGGSRLIALALLRPGYESRYQTLDAAIHDVVCIGRILREERLSGGRYNMLLQGLQRARVLKENTEFPYRRGFMEMLSCETPDSSEESACRAALRAALCRPSLLPLIEESRWLDSLDYPEPPLSDLVDVLAAAIVWDAEGKQAFLAETRVAARTRMLCAALGTLATELTGQADPRVWARAWPPACSEN